MPPTDHDPPRAIRAFRPSRDLDVDPAKWPATVPAVAQILRGGLELAAGLTVLVGENGSGKSTVVEMLAEVYGLNPQGGSRDAQLFRTRPSEPGIGQYLYAERGAHRHTWSYFLRADTMHAMYTYLEENPGGRPESLHERSHGEGFLDILRTRVNQPGFYLMDEPDAPLSFTSCLGLAALLHDLAIAGAQVIVATHSPVPRRHPRRDHPGARRLGDPSRVLGKPGTDRPLARVPGQPGEVLPPPAGRWRIVGHGPYRACP